MTLPIKKMIEESFTLLGNINIGNFNIDKPDWDVYTKRQEIFIAHRHTKAIMLREGDLVYDGIRFSDHKFLEKYIEIFDLILKETGIRLNQIYNAIFVLMPSNTVIEEHIDAGVLLENLTRVHVPIVTNDKVMFTVGDETINMKEGEIWAIDNLTKHSVINNGSDRIHLIFDYI